jgi:hypothetical protein
MHLKCILDETASRTLWQLDNHRTFRLANVMHGALSLIMHKSLGEQMLIILNKQILGRQVRREFDSAVEVFVYLSARKLFAMGTIL